ncbi:MAG: 6-phosphofructokinase [Planctomycetota bacterium]
MRIFFSYDGRDGVLVRAVHAHLVARGVEVFCYQLRPAATGDFFSSLHQEVKTAEAIVYFAGVECGTNQSHEVNWGLSHAEDKKILVVAIGNQQKPAQLPQKLQVVADGHTFLKDSYSSQKTEVASAECARDILAKLGLAPATVAKRRGYLFVYERDILQHFADLRAYHDGKLDAERETRLLERLLRGAPPAWPTVPRWSAKYRENDLDESVIGAHGTEHDRVLASARCGPGALDLSCTFLEARPRRELLYPRQESNEVRVAILVAGGIAPGINAVIDGIVQRHHQYRGPASQPSHGLQVFGLRNGFLAFDDIGHEKVLLEPEETGAPGTSTRLGTARAAIDGGSLIGTARDEDLLDPDKRAARLRAIVRELKSQHTDILYVIGGDGSMKAAHELGRAAKEEQYDLSIVTIPKTMDNDILWVWQSFGFLSAVQSAREFIDHLHREVASNPRVCILQLFGSDSGFVVSHAVLASAPSHCDLALIPEVPFSLLDVARHLKRRIRISQRSIPHALIVMAETAIPTDALEVLGDVKPKQHPVLYAEIAKRANLSNEQEDAIRNYFAADHTVIGQTSDELRRAGMKLMKAGIEVLLPKIDPQRSANEPKWNRLRLFSNEPRHLLRSTPPTTADFIMAQRLGILAVDNAMAGYTDFMISQWQTEFVMVPLELVVLGRKRVPPVGIFWKSVLAKTGQKANLNTQKRRDGDGGGNSETVHPPKQAKRRRTKHPRGDEAGSSGN